MNKKAFFNRIITCGFIFGLITIIMLMGCTEEELQLNRETDDTITSLSPVEKIPPEERNIYDLIVIGAREEVIKRVVYDASYAQIDYPGGDVPSDHGACTDVVIRAFRYGNVDLQELIHQDMQKHFKQYPQNWGLKGPDPNIDHRRVPNQMKFFDRYARLLTLEVDEENLSNWQWGDVVYWKFPNGLEHCGIVSDRKNEHGVPLVIHNAGVAREEDCLTRWEIIGHYRYPPEE